MAKDKKDYLVGRKALQVFLTEEMHMRFKLLCTAKGLKMTEVATELVEFWVSENEGTPIWGIKKYGAVGKKDKE